MSAWTRRSSVQCSCASRPLLLPCASDASSSSACIGGCAHVLCDDFAGLCRRRAACMVHPLNRPPQPGAMLAGKQKAGLPRPTKQLKWHELTVTALVPSMGPKVCRKAQAVSSAPPCGRAHGQDGTLVKFARLNTCFPAHQHTPAQPAGCKCTPARTLTQLLKMHPTKYTPAQPAARAAVQAPWQRAREGTAWGRLHGTNMWHVQQMLGHV